MFEISDLKAKKLPELQEIAKGLNIPKFKTTKKLDLVYQILDVQASNPKAVIAKVEETAHKANPKPRRARAPRARAPRRPPRRPHLPRRARSAAATRWRLRRRLPPRRSRRRRPPSRSRLPSVRREAASELLRRERPMGAAGLALEQEASRGRQDRRDP